MLNNRKLLLGVDGGNTKTDFFLFTDDGSLAADLRTGTCSHEALPGGYPDAGRALGDAVGKICRTAGVSAADIDSAAMGLAGVDIPSQHENMTAQVQALGLARFVISNDSMLGVKAAAPGGTGICSINGTGTVTGGIDPEGNVYQVGGIGGVTSDYAGGGYLAREVVKAVYSEYCRDGEKTAMTKPVSELIGITGTDTIMDMVHDTKLRIRPIEKTLCRLLFASAGNGDKVAREIVSRSAREMAASVAGCYKLLRFPAGKPAAVVLAGSVWAKCGYPPFSQEFKELLEERIGVPVDLIVLEEPPALGAVLWAYELAYGTPPDQAVRQSILNEIRRVRANED